MGKSTLDYFAIWMTIMGTVLSVIGTLISLELWSKSLGFFIMAVFLVFAGILMLWFLYKWDKYKSYYEAYPIINRGFSKANSIVNPDIKDSESLTEDLRTLQDFSSDIAEAFSVLTNTKCAVCIKLLVGKKGNDHAWVETFVRDYYSGRNRLNKDQEHVNHWLESNTDFSYIFDEKINHELTHKYYACNSLATETRYRNSRLPKWWFAPTDVNTYADKEFSAPPYIFLLHYLRMIPIISGFANRYFWPLPYRSGIVVPIVPLNTTSLKETRLQGYLCIDSNSSNAFDELMDVQIVLGIADGIDPALRKISKQYLSEEDTH